MRVKKVIVSGLIVTMMLNLAGCGGSPGKTKQHSQSVKTEKKAQVSSKKIEQKSNEVTVKVKK